MINLYFLKNGKITILLNFPLRLITLWLLVEVWSLKIYLKCPDFMHILTYAWLRWRFSRFMHWPNVFLLYMSSLEFLFLFLSFNFPVTWMIFNCHSSFIFLNCFTFSTNCWIIPKEMFSWCPMIAVFSDSFSHEKLKKIYIGF